jgi:hypothetical protein
VYSGYIVLLFFKKSLYLSEIHTNIFIDGMHLGETKTRIDFFKPQTSFSEKMKGKGNRTQKCRQRCT